MARVCVKIMHVFVKLSKFFRQITTKTDNFTKTCMILTQTRAIGLLLNSHTVKHVNCYGSSHYFLKILFINHTYKIQTKQGKSVEQPSHFNETDETGEIEFMCEPI
jgi:hypothetical protein